MFRSIAFGCSKRVESHARSTPFRFVGFTCKYRRSTSTTNRTSQGALASQLWAPSGGFAAKDVADDQSVELLKRAGFLRQSHSGILHLLPLGLRVQEKLESLIDEQMHGIGASKVALSSITSEALWRQSGRLGQISELLRIKDRKDSKYMLAPTHEEEITSLVSSATKSYKDLPLYVYQISRKFRDELRPRQGLLRAKEFLMKDLYTFDVDVNSAQRTYAKVQEAYENFFSAIGLRYIIAKASSGAMGGNMSHEYHYESSIGEDTLFECKSCGFACNEEEMPDAHQIACPSCEASALAKKNAIEVAHTFFLGTRYTEPLGTTVANAEDQQVLLQMGCYGIGLSRLVGAIALKLRTKDSLRWPANIAPYQVAVLVAGSPDTTAQDSQDTWQAAKSFYSTLLQDDRSTESLRLDDAILDDRDRSLGWKLKDASLIGYPVVIVFGKTWDKADAAERVVDLIYNLPEADDVHSSARRKSMQVVIRTLSQIAARMQGGEASMYAKSAERILRDVARLQEELEELEGKTLP